MGAFEYVALDDSGKEKKGVLEGDTARQVRQQLRDQGWMPLDVSESSERASRSGQQKVKIRRGVSATDLALVTRQLATLVRAGLPLEETLQAAAQQTEKARLKSMLLAVRSRVMEGHTLATGLADFPHVFPEIYRTTVSAGEQSGHLEVVLERLADYTENRQQMQSKIQLALFYPALLTLVAVGVVIGLMTFVVPQVVQVFDNIGQELPGLTRTLIAMSDFLRNYGLMMLVLMALAGGGLAWLLKKEGPKRRFHEILLRLPLIGRLERGVNALWNDGGIMYAPPYK